MNDLAIVGGVYLERCIQPLWNAVYGSGGRAAQCVSSLLPGRVWLHTYVAEQISADIANLASDFGVELIPTPARYVISFDYLHPLSTPIIHPSPGRLARHDPILVDRDVVLRYGMLEGDAIISARTAIYDPQSAFGAQHFADNGSRADRLAVVMNQREAQSMTGAVDPRDAAETLITSRRAEVVVIKMGGKGALVATLDNQITVPVYRTERVWKLGSGDVFSATFAALWGCNEMSPFEAGDLASRATAAYCDSRALPTLSVESLRAMTNEPVTSGSGMIYLAGPFFDLGQRWLVEEARTLLKELGAVVFSPVHEVGPGPAHVIAPDDIKGLEAAHVIFAILNGLDTGTIFEIGYAVKRGIPVVALAQNIKEEDLKMIEGAGCEIVDDFVSALYRAAWRLPSS